MQRQDAAAGGWFYVYVAGLASCFLLDFDWPLFVFFLSQSEYICLCLCLFKVEVKPQIALGLKFLLILPGRLVVFLCLYLVSI